MRRRILQLYERGKGTREIAQFFGFCVAAVRRVRQQFRQRGTLQPRTHLSGRHTLFTQERKQPLQELLSDQPDATLAEWGARLDRPFRTSTIDLWLRQLGWRYKKNSGRRPTSATCSTHATCQLSFWREHHAFILILLLMRASDTSLEYLHFGMWCK
jgi:transposase